MMKLYNEMSPLMNSSMVQFERSTLLIELFNRLCFYLPHRIINLLYRYICPNSMATAIALTVVICLDFLSVKYLHILIEMHNRMTN